MEKKTYVLREACSHLSESTLRAGGWMLSKEEPLLNTEGAYSDSQTIAKDVAASYSSESQSNKEADSASKVISSTVSFLCELCQEIFTTRQNLFLHFVKATGPHHPCQKQFDDETEESKRICLRVFNTARGLKIHQTKQALNPRHHAPGKTFPNLKE